MDKIYFNAAKHEFGHHIAARALGFSTGKVIITHSLTSIGSAETDTYRPINSIMEMEKFCNDRIKVLYAGVHAEALNNGCVDNEEALQLFETSGASDKKSSHQLLLILRNIRYHNLLRTEAIEKIREDEARLWQETTDLVEKYCNPITELAKHILRLPIDTNQSKVMTEEDLNNHKLLQEIGK